MINIFMRLLTELCDVNYGTVTEANMYAGGKFSQIKLETQNSVYTLSISKEKETDGNGNN